MWAIILIIPGKGWARGRACATALVHSNLSMPERKNADCRSTSRALRTTLRKTPAGKQGQILGLFSCDRCAESRPAWAMQRTTLAIGSSHSAEERRVGQK